MYVTVDASKNPVTGRARILALLRRGVVIPAPAIKDGYAGLAMRMVVLLVLTKRIGVFG